MKVTTNIGKLDLIKFNMSVLPRMRSTYITILVIASLTFLYIMSSAKNGVLGEHSYTLLPEELIEKTSANESLNKWHGVVSVKLAGSYLLIQVAACLFHVIPKRSFDSSEQFEEFTSQAIAHWQQAHSTTNNQAQPS